MCPKPLYKSDHVRTRGVVAAGDFVPPEQRLPWADETQALAEQLPFGRFPFVFFFFRAWLDGFVYDAVANLKGAWSEFVSTCVKCGGAALAH